MTPRRPVTTWYLEMTSPAELRPARPVPGFAVRHLDPPDAELSRRMYDEVGAPYEWTDRLAWDLARWEQHVGRPEVDTWIGLLDGEAVGYGEVLREGDDIEIASFGLRPGYPGRGLGGALLEAVTREAWARGASRVWLHTCSLDSPAALPAYERRGFRRYDEVTR